MVKLLTIILTEIYQNERKIKFTTFYLFMFINNSNCKTGSLQDESLLQTKNLSNFPSLHLFLTVLAIDQLYRHNHWTFSLFSWLHKSVDQFISKKLYCNNPFENTTINIILMYGVTQLTICLACRRIMYCSQLNMGLL